MSKMIFTRCLRCNRILKNDLAKERGYGSYCWHLHQLEVSKRKKTLFDTTPTNNKKV